MLRWIHSWLVAEDPPEKADVLFVLAGLQARKEYAVKLFQVGWSRQILFSVGRFELRRFPKLGLPESPDLLTIAKNIPPPQRHYFVLLQDGAFTVERIPVRRLGTLGEIDALANWLVIRPEISSLTLISSGPHLRRLRLCCAALLPRSVKTSFRAIPEEHSTDREEISREELQGWSARWFELMKLICYAIFLPVWRLSGRGRSRPTLPLT